MSCISLRLPPAGKAIKAWKSFTSTLGKLRKIHGSKVMKKPRKRLNTTTITRSPRVSMFLATKRSRRKRLATLKSAIHRFHKRPAPVYIDKLFKEPACDFVEQLKPQIAHNPRIEKLSKLPADQAGEEEEPGTSHMEDRSDSDKPCTSDDMWESVALASPLMHGINERAEEFIVRFREEMVAQEKILARNF